MIDPRKLKLGHKLQEEERISSGRALCVWNEPGWGQLVADGKHNGHFDDRLVRAVVDMIVEWAPTPEPAWLTYVPSLRHPALVPDFASLLATALRLPLVPLVQKVRETQPQKAQQNSPHQELNVRGAFELVGDPLVEPVLLIDDVVDSRWTLVEIGALLRVHGSGPVYPLALASLQGRDS